MPTVRLWRAVVVLALVVGPAMLLLLALEAVLLVPGALLAVLGLDALAVRAGVGVVVHLAVLRRVFVGICVERVYFGHMFLKATALDGRIMLLHTRQYVLKRRIFQEILIFSQSK